MEKDDEEDWQVAQEINKLWYLHMLAKEFPDLEWEQVIQGRWNINMSGLAVL